MRQLCTEARSTPTAAALLRTIARTAFVVSGACPDAVPDWVIPANQRFLDLAVFGANRGIEGGETPTC